MSVDENNTASDIIEPSVPVETEEQKNARIVVENAAKQREIEEKKRESVQLAQVAYDRATVFRNTMEQFYSNLINGADLVALSGGLVTAEKVAEKKLEELEARANEAIHAIISVIEHINKHNLASRKIDI